MMKRQLKKASLDELLAAYLDAATTHGAATESGDYKAGNKASDLIAAIYAELRRRGEDAQRSLLPFLGHDDPGVRLWSASHALEFAPSEGEAVLRALIPVGRFLGMSAKTTLTEWEKGRLRFP
jgi:hypothetical protein